MAKSGVTTIIESNVIEFLKHRGMEVSKASAPYRQGMLCGCGDCFSCILVGTVSKLEKENKSVYQLTSNPHNPIESRFHPVISVKQRVQNYLDKFKKPAKIKT